MAETRLGPTVDDNQFNIPGYSTIRQDRNTGEGGIALYVRNTLEVKILAKSDTTWTGKPEVPEYLACRVWQGDGPPILLFLIYRPPTVPFFSPDNPNKNSRNKLKIKQSPLLTDLRTLCPQYSHKIVMGDLNADLLSKSSEAEFLREHQPRRELSLLD